MLYYCSGDSAEQPAVPRCLDKRCYLTAMETVLVQEFNFLFYAYIVMQSKKNTSFFKIKNLFFFKNNRPKKIGFLCFFIIIFNLKAGKCF